MPPTTRCTNTPVTKVTTRCQVSWGVHAKRSAKRLSKPSRDSKPKPRHSLLIQVGLERVANPARGGSKIFNPLGPDLHRGDGKWSASRGAHHPPGVTTLGTWMCPAALAATVQV